MSDCKENVLEMIDAALTANRQGGYCSCVYHVADVGWCNHCKIRKGLEEARACIVASVGRLDVMRSNMIEMQAEIEEKLKRILGE